MFSPQALLKGLVSKLLPSKTPDGAESEGALRLNEYRELITPLTRHGLAKDGTYFATPNPALGTAVAGAVIAAFSATSAAFVVQNTGDPSNPDAKNIDLDMIKFMYTVAPASATGFGYAVVIDDVSRVPTGGFALLATTLNVGALIRSTAAKIWAFTGAAFMTVPAAGPNARTVARGSIPGLPVVGTEHMVRFGADGQNSAGSTHEPPVSIPPGKFAVVHVWWPSNAVTGPSMEYLVGAIER